MEYNSTHFIGEYKGLLLSACLCIHEVILGVWYLNRCALIFNLCNDSLYNSLKLAESAGYNHTQTYVKNEIIMLGWW